MAGKTGKPPVKATAKRPTSADPRSGVLNQRPLTESAKEQRAVPTNTVPTSGAGSNKAGNKKK